MKHTSRLFGEFTYKKDQIITFPKGLVGFPGCQHFVLRKSAKTAPVQWLLSVDDDGPDFAVIDPHLIDDRCTVRSLHVGRTTLDRLGAEDASELRQYAVVTVPEDTRRISMNLRAPILISPGTRRGVQRLESEMKTRAVRRPIYRELTGDEIEKTSGQLVLHRKLNETIRIGDDIVIEVISLEDGGVRLGVSAPKDVSIRRGENNVEPDTQMWEAQEDVDVEALASLLRESRARVDAAAG